MLAHQFAIAFANVIGFGAGRKPENEEGIVRHVDVPRPDAREIGLGEAEDFRHAPEEAMFAGVEGIVGLGDVEQRVEHILQHFAARLEQFGDLPGIGLEARDVLLGEVEDTRDRGQFAIGNVEDLLEGPDLVFRHDAVGLGHLGAQPDHADGEGDGFFRRRRVAVDDRLQESSHRLANRCEGVGDAGPDGHGKAGWPQPFLK